MDVLFAALLALAIVIMIWDGLCCLAGRAQWIPPIMTAMVLVGVVEALIGSGPTWWPLIAGAAAGMLGAGRRPFRHTAMDDPEPGT